jgi:UDP-glucose 4-epimerase
MSSVRNLLVPGGLGFIGSHTVLHIIQQTDANVIIIDDLSNCFPDVLQRIQTILSKILSQSEIEKRVRFHQGSILNMSFLDGIFRLYRDRGEAIDGVMHFAAKKAIGESYQLPLEYYENNVVGSINLFKMM